MIQTVSRIGSICLLACCMLVASFAQAQTNPALHAMSASKTSDSKIRVWTATMGGHLASAIIDGSSAAWDIHVTSGVSGGVAAMGTGTESVFYVGDGQVRLLRVLNGVDQTIVSLPLGATGRSFANSDVALLPTGSELLVSAISTDGRICIWSSTNNVSFGTPLCSGTSVASSGSDIAPIAFVNSSNQTFPTFFYRGASGSLRRVVKTSTGLSHTNMGSPNNGSIDDALSAVADVGVAYVVVTSAGRVYQTKLNQTNSFATWTAIPALPNGATPLMVAGNRAAFPSATPFGASIKCHVRLGVSSTDGIYEWLSTASANNSSTTPPPCPAIDLSTGTWSRVGKPSSSSNASVGMVLSTGFTTSTWGTSYIMLGSPIQFPVPYDLVSATGGFINYGHP